ncbi:MAG: hypothetical protein ICV77_05965 [Cyanobacteria bacterium Co-bin8]|nr:hypothetical protein [Cyanobacteria bacterium Co-bin8]
MTCLKTQSPGQLLKLHPAVYKDALSPWCIVRLLPNMQRITVARFRRRNDADAHVRVLRRLIPEGTYVILFDGAIASPAQPSQQ